MRRIAARTGHPRGWLLQEAPTEPGAEPTLLSARSLCQPNASSGPPGRFGGQGCC